MSSSPKSKSESLHLNLMLLLEESNSDPVPSSPKVNNNNVAKKTTLIMQCEVVRRRSLRLSLSQGFRRSPRLSSDRGSLGKSEKSPPPRQRSSTSTSTSKFASPQSFRNSMRCFKLDIVLLNLPCSVDMVID